MDYWNSDYLLSNFVTSESILPTRNIFLHFVDHEFLSLTYLDKAASDSVFQQMRRVIVVALLVTDSQVYMPASAYFETDYARDLFYCFPEFREFGLLSLIGNAFSVGDFVESKRSQKDHTRYPRYLKDREIRRLLSTHNNWHRRLGNTTRDIGIGWVQSINMQEQIWISLAHRHGIKSLAGIEKNLLAVPDRIGDTGFIADHVIPILQLSNPTTRDTSEVNAFITQQYFYSYLKELRASCLVDLPFADSKSVLGELRGHISYKKLLQLWRRLGIDHFIFSASERELIDIRLSNAWSVFVHQYCWPYALQNNNTLAVIGNQARILPKISFSDHATDLGEVIRRVEMLIESTGDSRGLEKANNRQLEESSERKFIIRRDLPKKPTMFIVHGHDDKTKLEVKNYLQNTLHLPEPIILHEQPSLSRSIIEKFEVHANRADGAIVLLTPDDLWVKDGTDEEFRRARQNVIFELGYFYAKFGREGGKVLLLYKGNLEIPSDIEGVLYIDITNGVKAAGEQIRKELNWIS